MTSALLSQAAKYAELVNSGCVWQAKSATCAAVVALPTTASVMAVMNNNSEGSGLNMVVLLAGAIQIAGPASMTCMSIIYSPQILKPAVYTNSITPTNVKPYSGTYGGKALLDDTGTVVDNGWYPLGSSFTNPLASTPGMQVWVDVAGLLVIPPGGGVGLHVMASTTAVTAQVVLVWAEIHM